MKKNPASIPHSIWHADDLRRAEKEAADSLGITLYELMQRAGEAAFNVAREAYPCSSHSLILCGHGNNGGDGYVVALLMGLSGQAAAGFWGLALRYLKAPATLVGGAVSQALYPRLANAQPADAQRAVRQIMALLGAMAVALMLVLMSAGPWLFLRIFGAQWREAGELARALAPYIAAHFVAAPLAVVTMAWQAQRWAFRWALVGQFAFVAALGLGLRWGGLIAGAWAVSAAMVVYFGIYFWRLAFWRDIPHPEPHSAAEPGVEQLVEEQP